MKGDFTRFTHKPDKHYTSVLKQQGRVDLDADWNEQASIQAYLDEEESKDIIGLTGVPSRLGGFEISGFGFAKGDTENGVDFNISPGRIYVDGILCLLEKRDHGAADIEAGGKMPVSYLNQPDYPGPEKISPVKGRKDLVYLDVWKRHITAIEDSDLREVALGGPDTTTRLKTVWQVKVLTGVEGDDPCNVPEWLKLISPAWGEWGWGRLSVKLASSNHEESPCATDPEGGYRGRENRLYRVEIHDGGIIEDGLAAGVSQPTFKWSRDNGALVFPIQEVDSADPRRVKIKRLGKDQFLTLHRGDWVEVIDDSRELLGKPGIMAEIVGEIDLDQLIVTLSKNVDDIDVDGGHAKLRRWDQMGDAISIWPSTPIDLEAGVQVQFTAGIFRTGDYWVFTARSSGDVELLEEEPPMGIEHNYCMLALVTWKTVGKKNIKADVLDCRRTFPSMNDLTCLYYVGGDGQEAMPGEELGQPLQVGVSNGQIPLKGPSVAGMKVEFEIIRTGKKISKKEIIAIKEISADGKYGLLSKVRGRYPPTYKTVVVPVGKDGIAKCYWKLGTGPLSQQVEARLIDACGDPVHLPIRFSANLSVASEVAYDQPRCLPMEDESAIKSVRDALNTLCENFGLYYVSGDGQEAKPGNELKRPLQVRAANGKWPVKGIKVRFTRTDGDGSIIQVHPEDILEGVVKLETLTGADGIAECEYKLRSEIYHQIEAQMLDADNSPIGLPVRFNASASVAYEVGYTPSPSCSILDGVDNVEDAINTLCGLPRGGGCAVAVGKGSPHVRLSQEFLNELFAEQQGDELTGVCICMLPGEHNFPGFEVSDENSSPVHLKIVGSGRGTNIRLDALPWSFKDLESVTLKDLSIKTDEIGELLTFDNCREVTVESCNLVGTTSMEEDLHEPEERGFAFDPWGSYNEIGFRYFAGYVEGGHLYDRSGEKSLLSDEQLSMVLYDDDHERTITTGNPLQLKENYELQIKDINLEGDKVYVELIKDGESVHDAVVEPSKEGATIEDKTYVYKKDLGDTEDIVIIAVNFKNAFRGAEQNLATVDGIWQISDDPVSIDDVPIVLRRAILRIGGADKISLKGNVIVDRDQSRLETPVNVFGIDEDLAALNVRDDKIFREKARDYAQMLAGSDKSKRIALGTKFVEFMGRPEATTRLMMAEKKQLGNFGEYISSKDRVSPGEIFSILDNIRKTAVRNIIGNAVIISDGHGRVVIDGNELAGLLGLYGPSMPRMFSPEELSSLHNWTDKIKFSNLGGSMLMSDNRITGMVASWDVIGSILEFIDHAGSEEVELDVFEWMHLSNNIFEEGDNMWLARDLRLTGNDFGDTDSSYAGEAINRTSLYVGNCAQEDIDLLNVSLKKLTRSANPFLNIQ